MPLTAEFVAELTLAGLRVKEAHLRRVFQAEARATNLQRGYISAPFVNQLVDLDFQGLASDLIAHRFSGLEIDKVVMIPNSGNPLATTVAERLKVPLVPGRKGAAIPGAWNTSIMIQEEAASFTTGEMSTGGEGNPAALDFYEQERNKSVTARLKKVGLFADMII